MRKNHSIHIVLVFLLVISLLVTGCSLQKKHAESADRSISVAIYPWLLDIELFEDILRQEWEKLEPDVELNLERWNCYEDPTECDVMMYDGIILTSLVENGSIHPIEFEEIEDPDGLIPFALEGSKHMGQYYGVPFLLCGDVLIYHKDDAETAAIESIPQLYDEVMMRRETDETAGVVVSTVIDNPYHYLDALVDTVGEYSTYDQMPDCSDLNQEALNSLIKLHDLAADIPKYELMDMRTVGEFCDGAGFAFFGVTENMMHMESILDGLEIKALSYSEGENIPMYYVDITSVASHVTDPEKLQLCKKLMNMIGSEDFMEAWFLESGEPQYLLAARQNTYLSLAKTYPMYSQLYEIAMNEQNKAFRAGADFNTYIDSFPKLFEE